MDPTQLERDALEGKDRDELTTIATALGGKPGSRARKAEIVDLILDLAGIETSSNGSSPSTGAAPVEELIEEPPAEWEVAVSEESDEAEASSDDRSAESAESVSEESAEAEASSDDRSAESAESRSGRQGQQGNRGQQGQQDPESGNRRRRRRGRGQSDGPEEQWDGEPVEVEGYLDMRDEGYGFLRTNNYKPSKADAYVSVKQAHQYGLRKGDHLTGASRPANRSERNPALLRIDTVNGGKPEDAKGRPRFEDLTPLFPDEHLKMETPDDPTNMTARIVDLLCPIGKGQRGLLVSPPKAGKTTILKQIARSIEVNNPEVKLIVLLVDERPEEVTDMRRWLKHSEVAASTFDRPSDEHTRIAEITIERAKRMVESGHDVVILLDGITRLSRAYNLAAPATGRIMSGGLDSGSLYPPKRFFGAARNVEEGGSLTILATALVETGSKMDEVIFEEFKGTGNMEAHLDRKLAEKRVYPALNIRRSGTRREDLIASEDEMQRMWILRKLLNPMDDVAATEFLIDRLKDTKTNIEFFEAMKRR